MATKCDKYDLRQFFVMLSIWLQGMGCGVILAYPTVLKESLSKGATDFFITAEQSSLLASCVGISGVFGFIFYSVLLNLVGRKFLHITIISIQLLSWITCYFATSVVWLFVGRLLHGFIFGITYIISQLIGEYTSPQTRGYYVTLTKMTMSSGSLIYYSLSYGSWREPAIAGIVLSLIGIILNLFWPESPAYCAMKGRLEECKKNFIWLNGTSLEKRMELTELISAQIIDRNASNQKNTCSILTALREKAFQKALLITSLLTLIIDCSGRYFVLAYTNQIMLNIVGSESVMYYSIFVNVLAPIAFLLSCFILKHMKRRTILFLFGSFIGLLMLVINLILFLESKNIVSNSVWILWFLICVQNFLVNLSIVPVCFTLFGEIFPLQCKSLGSCLSGIVFSILYGINLKITPIMLKSLGLGGTYGVFGVSLLLTLFILSFIMLETKNKTLQQIEDELKGVKRHSDDQVTERLNDFE